MPSWNATTPGDSWLLVEARTASDAGAGGPGGRRWSRWFTLAHWADSDREIHPTSVPGQVDTSIHVETDVLAADDGLTWSAYQLRVSLVRRVGSSARPRITMVGAMASHVPADAPRRRVPRRRRVGHRAPRAAVLPAAAPR